VQADGALESGQNLPCNNKRECLEKEYLNERGCYLC
jgi:hypothetical protein